MSSRVADVADAHRYELRRQDELVSWADYRLDGDVMVITHVETVPHHRDQGNSERLMDGLVADVAARRLRLRGSCWVATDYLRRHPDLDLDPG